MTSINQEPSSANPDSSADQDSPDRWTIKRLLDWTAEFFKGKGADQSRLDAEVLLAEALNCQRIELYTRFDDEPDEAQRTTFRQWVQRHGEGEPVAYLVGHREFFSLKFKVNSSVLIPRPETEHLVTESLDLIAKLDSESPCVVDVGTGSGNIIISLGKHAPSARLFATDISSDALALANENAIAHGLESRIDFVQSDLLDAFPEEHQFDIVVSNPPYIGLSEKPSLDRSVVEFEPHSALFSEGSEGTETIARLVEQSRGRLKPGGFLIFEISPMIANACREIIEQSGHLELVTIKRDLASLERVVIAKRSS